MRDLVSLVQECFSEDDHIALYDIQTLNLYKSLNRPQSFSDRPFGIWYGRGKNWLTHVLQTTSFKPCNIVKLEIDNSRVLRLKESNDIVRFACQYGSPISSGMVSSHSAEEWHIDWTYVSTKYDGIQIECFCPELLHIPQFIWYNGWVVNSGCIWNTGAIKSTQRTDALSGLSLKTGKQNER